MHARHFFQLIITSNLQSQITILVSPNGHGCQPIPIKVVLMPLVVLFLCFVLRELLLWSRLAACQWKVQKLSNPRFLLLSLSLTLVSTLFTLSDSSPSRLLRLSPLVVAVIKGKVAAVITFSHLLLYPFWLRHSVYERVWLTNACKAFLVIASLLLLNIDYFSYLGFNPFKVQRWV